MSNNLKMGNKHNCPNIEKPKIEKNKDDEDLDQIYNEYIKALNLDPTKLENNLKKCTKNNELIILIESGALAPPHRMHIGIMELVKKYFEENDNNKKIIGGFIIPSSDNYVKHKLKKDFIPLKHRVNMTKILIKNNDWLECLDWDMAYGEEIKICIDKIIKNKFPEYNIKSYLVFGVDFYIRCHMHLKSEQICIYRPGYDLEMAKKMYPENLIFIEGNNQDISSTQIRKAIRDKDEKKINELMCEEMISYINNNQIFNEN